MTRTSRPEEDASRDVALETHPDSNGADRAESPTETVAAAVHAINNPVFAILGLLEFLLADAEPGTRSRERLELIRESALEIGDTARVLRERSLTWEEGAS